jgi:Na+-translocating ferredoxin:NAD+ oxidoreductase RnfA subunit
MLVNGVMLSLATILVMAIANVAVASLRNLIPHEIRIPVFILIVAALVTVVDLVFNAYFHELYLVLGIFIPLIVTNCIVLARVEAFANKNPPLQSLLFDGIFMGVGMLWTLALLGGPARTDRRRYAVFRHRHGLSGAAAAAVAAGRLSRLPARHAAARRLHPARLPDRLEELGRGARAAARQAARPPSPPPGVGRQRLSGSTDERAASAMNSSCACVGQPRADHRTRVRQPFQLLIAVILSAQATDKSVNLATASCSPTRRRRRRCWRSAKAVSTYINRIGLYQSKARNVIATCRQLIDRHGGEVPAARACSARSAAGSRPQNGQRGPQHRFRRSRRSPSTRTSSASPTAPAWRRQDAAGGRTRVAAGGAGRVPAIGTPLADPARALRLQGAQPDCWRCGHRRPLRLSREKPARRSRRPG